MNSGSVVQDAVLRVNRFTRLVCECGYEADVPAPVDKLNRDIVTPKLYEEHREVCPIQAPLVQEARQLIERLEGELLPPPGHLGCLRNGQREAFFGDDGNPCVSSANSEGAYEQYLRQEARARGERLGPSRVSPKYVEKDEVTHLTECYLRNYPDDEGAYCTCKDWSPS